MEASTSELTVRPAPKRRRPDLGGRSEEKVGRFLIAPGQLLLLFIVLFPAAIAIYIGFTAWSPTTGQDFWHAYEFWHWFDGYWEALTSTEFWSDPIVTWTVPAEEPHVSFVATLVDPRGGVGWGTLTFDVEDATP